MPARNAIKQYVENSYYHIYNRGVEKRLIFQEEQDYAVFLSYLRDYLLPKDVDGLTEILASSSTTSKEKDKALKLLRLNNFSEEITLISYCLMPNHFHFQIKQRDSESIDRFINSLGTRYTIYFNRKYKRVGPLYQGVYKAVLVKTDEQLQHLVRYIHKQALELGENQPCSHLEFLGLRKTSWVHPKEILPFFSKTKPSSAYESFMGEVGSTEIIKDLILED